MTVTNKIPINVNEISLSYLCRRLCICVCSVDFLCNFLCFVGFEDSHNF